jgi:hypothetical protein
MKNIIYQYWCGNPPNICKASTENIKYYADKIGAEHKVEYNPSFSLPGGDSKYYGALRPIYDEFFHQYDNVLFLDMDIFAVNNLKENIFEQGVKEIGICTEPHKIPIRKKRTTNISAAEDIRWDNALFEAYGKRMPRDANNDIKIYNTGVVLYTNEGLKKARENFITPSEYISKVKNANLNAFYVQTEQPYLHSQAAMFLEITELNNGWNSYIHWGEKKTPPREVTDTRTGQTKLVHIQLRGHRDNSDKEFYRRMVNLPVGEWNLNDQ